MDEEQKPAPAGQPFDPVGFQKAILDMHKQRVAHNDKLARAAWEANCCPQCKSGVHPEVLVLIRDYKPPLFEPATNTLLLYDLVCCIRCEESVRKLLTGGSVLPFDPLQSG